MICPFCGAPGVPDDSVQCPFCKASLKGRSAAERIPPPPAAPAKSPYALSGILAAIAVVLVLALLWALHRPHASVVAAPASTPPPPGPAVTQAPTPAAPPPGPAVTAAPTPVAPKAAPPDPNKAAVQAYLTQIGSIERQREAAVSNTSDLLVTLEVAKAMEGGLSEAKIDELTATTPEEEAAAKKKVEAEGTGKAVSTMDSYTTAFRQLDAELRAIRPPQPAFQFAAAYDNSFAQYISAIDSIGQAVQSSQNGGDPTKAIASLRAASGPLSNQAAQGLMSADNQLAALCAKYNIPKPFDIKDQPSGGLTSVGG